MASILLVEDEALIRMMVDDMLTELGHQVVAEAGDLASGLAFAESGEDFDLAILDVQLGRDSSRPIAEALEARKIPFAFASGYGADGMPEGFHNRPTLMKPFKVDELQRCIAKLLR
ncbi:response regulator [Bradyrhizobium sp. 40]|uniref:response regulator n=1 Tax=Bradyrhizobium sp. 40 TaxID=2782674 RepID=UPI001FFE5B58|nr:response regulator [Bradyrhizobium sp. 40]UPJ44932.1 response regulator [Bradyrhizobium sp. 40]